ncbi:XRE family transcriptional regulator [Oenococcus oeni]|uniref:helix-turn-helix domain-containing protein n=2 Tax=Oenococcus oeni TaxID=1247 RepID=UPI0008F81DCB|nr:helix-turn-helix transcriptional regulator [Oenococcus oeni]OIM35588.1 XRE family transcriptional regulator [Oenococcus oeni]
MTLFDKIQIEAQKQGMEIPDLAEKTGVSKSTIYTWKSNKANTDSLLKIANFLHLSTDYLLGNDEIGQLTPQQYTIANHADPDMTDEQLEKVNEFIDFIQNKKK